MKGIVLDLKDITDSREVMESKESPKIRCFIYILLAVIISAVVFACFFEIDEYTKVSGEIKTLSASGLITSSSSCKLDEILVSEGQHVKKGDILFTLDADYANEQMALYQKKLSGYNDDLANTELLRKSVNEDKNLFKNDSSDSKYYYRYEQYKNGVLMSAQEIDNSRLDSSLSEEEKESNLKSTKQNILQKEQNLKEYKNLICCVEADAGYSGTNPEINAAYSQYITSYEKSKLIIENSRLTYENTSDKYNNRPTEPVSLEQAELAKQKSDSTYSALQSYQSSYLADIRSHIVLLENQLVSDNTNDNARTTLNIYKDLKNALENGLTFSTDNADIQASYNDYTEKNSSLSEEYSKASAEYKSLYEKYTQQSPADITQADVDSSRYSYESAVLDAQTIKNTFVSQIQTSISALNKEIDALKESKNSLELSLKGSKDLKKYEQLSGDKLKNEAIISINSELDSINENIIAVKSQISEIDQTIKNSEIEASFNGTVTLVGELNSGDVIQGGSSLCTLIPDTDQLKATLYIPENEVSKIDVGQKTEYIFDAIPYNEYGKVTGEILSISADSISNESTGGKYYIAQADISALSLKNSNGDIREIKTGMLVEAKTISGSKKAIVWLLEKINFIE